MSKRQIYTPAMFLWKHLMTVWRSTKWRCDDTPTNRNQMFPLFCRSDDKRDVRDVLWLKSGSVHARCQVKYCKYWLLYCPLFSKESYSSLERMFSLRLQFRQSSLLSLKLYLKGEIGNFTNTPRSFPVKGNNISLKKIDCVLFLNKRQYMGMLVGYCGEIVVNYLPHMVYCITSSYEANICHTLTV